MECPSVLVMGAFTVALVITDMLVWRGNRVVKHGILGGIATLLFFSLCERGYEMVNWSLLGLFVVVLLGPIFITSGNRQYRYSSEACDTCGMEDDICEC